MRTVNLTAADVFYSGPPKKIKKIVHALLWKLSAHSEPKLRLSNSCWYLFLRPPKIKMVHTLWWKLSASTLETKASGWDDGRPSDHFHMWHHYYHCSARLLSLSLHYHYQLIWIHHFHMWHHYYHCGAGLLSHVTSLLSLFHFHHCLALLSLFS